MGRRIPRQLAGVVLGPHSPGERGCICFGCHSLVSSLPAQVREQIAKKALTLVEKCICKRLHVTAWEFLESKRIPLRFRIEGPDKASDVGFSGWPE